MLQDDDIRAINDRALSDKEKEERRTLRDCAGMDVDSIFGHSLQDGVEVGEERHTLSWIWLTGRRVDRGSSEEGARGRGNNNDDGSGSDDDDDDTHIQEGELFLMFDLHLIAHHLYLLGSRPLLTHGKYDFFVLVEYT